MSLKRLPLRCWRMPTTEASRSSGARISRYRRQWTVSSKGEPSMASDQGLSGRRAFEALFGDLNDARWSAVVNDCGQSLPVDFSTPGSEQLLRKNVDLAL